MSMNGSYRVLLLLLMATFLCGFYLSSTSVSADDSAVDTVNIDVPIACTMSGVGMNTHTAAMLPGSVNSNIGTTTFTVLCNDSGGFSVYAIGFTDETDGKNVLASTIDSSHDIATGTLTSGNSQWAMKLTPVSSPTPLYPVTIQNGFNNFHTVPDDYTLVAKREQATDVGVNAVGSSFTSTYQVYVSTTQPADTYTGKVKYVLVHPNNTEGVHTITLTAGYGTTGIEFENERTTTSMTKVLGAGNTLNLTDISVTGYTDDFNGKKYYIKESNGDGTYTLTEINTNTYTISKDVEILVDPAYPKKCYTLNDTLTEGTYYMTDVYTYGYKRKAMSTTSWNSITGADGWGLRVRDRNYTGVIDEDICAYIDNKPIVSIEYAFRSSKASKIDVSSFYSNNITSVTGMFYGAAATEIKGLNNIDVSNVTTFMSTFSQVKVSTIDITDWDTSSATNMNTMFQGSSSAGSPVVTVYVSNKFVVPNGATTTNMFRYFTSIVGGNNTRYNSSYVTGARAIIDGTNGQPGYFTEGPAP